MGAFLSALRANAHLGNTVFEGGIGLLHVFAPHRIYGNNPAFAPADEQQLLGRFTGMLMLSVSFLSYAARGDTSSVAGRAVARALSLYHGSACGLNLVFGCGIDGDHGNSGRDLFHAAVHGCLAAGFLLSAMRGDDDGNAGSERGSKGRR